MAIIQAACPVCSGLSDQRLIHPPDINLIECSICGRFSIENDYITKIDRDKYASYLFYNCNLFSSINDKKKVFYFIGSDISYKDILYQYPSDIRHLRKEDVDNWYPKKFSEKIDYILLGLVQLSDYTGKSISLIGQKANSLFFVKRYTDDNLLPNEKINEQTEYYYT
jgi:Zn ribbon nucleic-acid-binding protein